MSASILNDVPSGTALQQSRVGLHICQIFGSDEEQQDVAFRLLLDGLRLGERACCFSDKLREPEVRSFLDSNGMPFSKATASGQLTLTGTRDVYFAAGEFAPERMLQSLRQFYSDSMALRYTAARVVGEMTSEVRDVPGGFRLLEYEAKVSILIRTLPITAVCQYDARAFDGAMIMSVLKVHPLMIVAGSVVHNPFFIPPERYLSS